MAYHAIQFLLFIARYIPSLNIFIGRFAAWLASGRTVAVDVSHRIFNLDCRVRIPVLI